MANKQKLVVIGNGMVGHNLIEKLVDSGAAQNYEITVFCEESRLAYDRVHLSEFFAGKSADDLALTTGEFYQQQGIRVLVGCAATAINREQKTIVAEAGEEVAYDLLVLATGSYPFVPPMPGHDRARCLVYRTI
ncbi:MAG: nitrite reductase (NAD(P)H), partial [Gammaproteobacteria bacterium]